MPSFTTSLGDIVNFRDNCFVTPLERMTAMGFPAAGCSKEFRDIIPMPWLPEKLTGPEVKRLIGNGMHLPAVYCWHMFIMANIRRRAELEEAAARVALSLSMRQVATDDDNGGSDDELDI
eukprot:3422759-Lingulodinium_polyedra.AAC.1